MRHNLKEASKKFPKEKQLKRQLIKLVVSAVLASIVNDNVRSFIWYSNTTYIYEPVVPIVLATPVQFVIGWQFYVGAYKTFVMGQQIWMFLSL